MWNQSLLTQSSLKDKASATLATLIALLNAREMIFLERTQTWHFYQQFENVFSELITLFKNNLDAYSIYINQEQQFDIEFIQKYQILIGSQKYIEKQVEKFYGKQWPLSVQQIQQYVTLYKYNYLFCQKKKVESNS